ncbi:Gamma-butyrobetaine dioxygenase, partial [Balamuthia mandrillaris]
MRNGALLPSVHGSVLCRPTGRRVRRGVGALAPMLRSSGNGFLAASRRCYAQMWTSATFPAEQENRFKISSFRKSADDDKHGRHVSIQWKDNTESKYHLKWLRDNCLCEACMDQDSGQRIFRVVDSDERMSQASAASVSSNEESLSVVWTDGHESSFPSSWLRRYCYGQTAKQERRRQRQPVLWMGNFWSSSSTSSSPAPSLDFEYDSIMNSDERRWEWLRHMSLYGLSVIRNVPTRDQEVMNVAQRTAGMIQDTIYGRSWDVKSVEK